MAKMDSGEQAMSHKSEVSKLTTVHGAVPVYQAVPKEKDEGRDKAADVFLESENSQERNLSNPRALIHLFKVFTGPSTIGMPRIIENGGIMFGSLAFIVIGYLNNWGNITLVKCSQILAKRHGHSAVTYEQIMEQSFLNCRRSKVLPKMAPFMRDIATLFLIMAQLGLVSVYIVAIGTTVHQYVDDLLPTANIPLVVTEMVVTMLLIPYTWMRNLKLLSWFSFAATGLTLVCVATVVQYSATNLLPISSFKLITPDLWTLPLFVGGSVNTVEGVAMVLPLENKAKNTQDFGGLCGLVTLAATFNINFNLLVGFYGYLATGDRVSDNILTILPNTWYYSAVSLAYAGALFLTYTLQLYLPAEKLAASMRNQCWLKPLHSHANWLSRTLLVICSFLFAVLVPSIELLMSLNGALSFSVLVFVLPAVAELCVLSEEPGGVPWNILIKDVVLLLFGIVAVVTGTYASLYTIIWPDKHY